MRSFSAQDILALWERGLAQPPAERALAILAAAFPEESAESLGALPVGRRDARLLRVYAALFGPKLRGFSQCAWCGERLETAADVAELLRDAPPETEAEAFELSAGGFDLRFRLPDSRDLIAVAACADPQAGRTLLAQRCVLEARRGGEAVPVAHWPDSLFANLAARMAECDPLAEIWLNLRCPSCEHAWSALFDVEVFLWAEIGALAKRLLSEVDALARVYGWREADILAMSAARRRLYLEMIG